MDDLIKPSKVRKDRRPLPSYLPRDVGGRYRILSLLGSGACGDVVEAFDMQERDLVALKLLRTERVSERLVKRFFREAEVMGRVQHPGMVQIRGCGTDSHGVHYLAMELVRGVSLRERMRDAGGRLSPWEVARIGIDVCEVLQVAHDMGVVHRDLKPGNLIVPQGWPDAPMPVKLVDFGVAKIYDGDGDNPLSNLTQSGESLGTPHYMAPEQVNGRAVDGRADLYGLGCLLYHALCGFRPVDGPNPFSVLMAHLEHVPPSLKDVVGAHFAPPLLSDLIDRLLAKRPEDRPVDAAEVAAELRPLLPQLPKTAATTVAAPSTDEELDTFGGQGRALEITSGSAIPAVMGPNTPPHVQQVGAKHHASMPTLEAVQAARPAAPAASLAPQPVRRSGVPMVVVGVAIAAVVVLLMAGAVVAAVLLTRQQAPAEPSGADAPPASSAPASAASAAPEASASPTRRASRRAAPDASAVSATSKGAGLVKVTLASTPKGASVIRNGRSLGETPLTVELARPLRGPAVFWLVAPHREPQAVILQPGEVNDKASLVIERDLAPVGSGNATVEIHTDPPGAEVHLGKRLMGITPVEIQQPLRKQTLTISLEAEGYEPREVILGLRAAPQLIRIPMKDASDPVPELIQR